MRFSIDPRAWPGSVLLLGISVVLAFLARRWEIVWAGLVLTGLHTAFFRDPVRKPDGPGLLAPADGLVVDVSEVFEDKYLREDAVKIGIFLSVFDVHVTRSPWTGKISWIQYFKGEFLNALKKESAVRNESNWIGIEDPEGRKAVVRQISGAIARRIYCDVKPGDSVERAGKLGVICYGSRVECYLPRRFFTASITPGTRVRAGQTLMGDWHK